MQEALELVASGMTTTIREVAEFLGAPEGTARKYLSRLASDYGLIDRTNTASTELSRCHNCRRQRPSAEDMLTSA